MRRVRRKGRAAAAWENVKGIRRIMTLGARLAAVPLCGANREDCVVKLGGTNWAE